MIGPFITFEGIDGAGKSTHIEPSAQALRKAGYKVVCTREPGGTALAEGLRDMVLHAPMDGVTETLLVFAARRDHVIQVIEPARARGEAVLCDRFSDATFAYQGFGRGQSLQWLGQLERIVHEGLQPDLTLWFDVDPRIAAERRAAARPADRFEGQGVAFFSRVRAGYLARLDATPQRFVRIDASLDRAGVADAVAGALGRFGAQLPATP